jgi:hypothetical protein
VLVRAAVIRSDMSVAMNGCNNRSNQSSMQVRTSAMLTSATAFITIDSLLHQLPSAKFRQHQHSPMPSSLTLNTQ